MPEFFRNAPIQRKLMLIILGSYAAALLMTAAVHSSFRIFSEISDLDPDVAARFDGAALAAILAISALIAYGVSLRLQAAISTPLRVLSDTAKKIARQKDYSVRAKKVSTDEVGQLTDAFNQMVGEIQLHDQSMRREIADRIRAEQELDKLHKQVLAATRQAGMAEVATGVLHNVGNVLNSVNISTSLLNEQRLARRATAANSCR
jgi:nitrate/nitrite-specific signal transduction histidine kinase